MPIIIWGTKGVTSQLDGGVFFCPHCNTNRDYVLSEVRDYFSLFFIPMIPLGAGQRFVECRTCSTPFQEGVLQLQQPAQALSLEKAAVPGQIQIPGGRASTEPTLSPEDQEIKRHFHLMMDGMSLGEAGARMKQAGVPSSRVDELLTGLGDEKTWKCRDCSRRYLKEASVCRACQG